jgi:hypothetical protein
MTKQEIQVFLDEADEDPGVVRKLREVVQEVDDNVPGDRTKEMMYDLVGTVLMLGERVRDIEYRLVPGDVRSELKRQSMKHARKEQKGWQRVRFLPE